jgi:C4-dicarboxylate-specific signal transduction histidine kinase
VDGSFVPDFFGNNILNGPKPANTDLNKCLMKIQKKGKTTAVYVMDTSSHLLWAEINYPDWSGH